MILSAIFARAHEGRPTYSSSQKRERFFDRSGELIFFEARLIHHRMDFRKEFPFAVRRHHVSFCRADSQVCHLCEW